MGLWATTLPLSYSAFSVALSWLFQNLCIITCSHMSLFVTYHYLLHVTYMSLFVTCHYLSPATICHMPLFVTCHYLSPVTICHYLSPATICHMPLFVTCHYLSLVVTCHYLSHVTIWNHQSWTNNNINIKCYKQIAVIRQVRTSASIGD